MKLIFLIVGCWICIFSLHCQENVFQKSPVSGTWVEISKNTDTLEFLPEYDGINPIVWLKRGKIDKNLPKEYSGPYYYELFENTISMKWFLSSNSGYHAYYFELSPDKELLKIGNFYNRPYEIKDTIVFSLIKYAEH